jgi:flagellum-specific peptidoglycan hydrolase FlgJ
LALFGAAAYYTADYRSAMTYLRTILIKEEFREGLKGLDENKLSYLLGMSSFYYAACDLGFAQKALKGEEISPEERAVLERYLNFAEACLMNVQPEEDESTETGLYFVHDLMEKFDIHSAEQRLEGMGLLSSPIFDELQDSFDRDLVAKNCVVRNLMFMFKNYLEYTIREICSWFDGLYQASDTESGTIYLPFADILSILMARQFQVGSDMKNNIVIRVPVGIDTVWEMIIDLNAGSALSGRMRYHAQLAEVRLHVELSPIPNYVIETLRQGKAEIGGLAQNRFMSLIQPHTSSVAEHDAAKVVDEVAPVVTPTSWRLTLIIGALITTVLGVFATAAKAAAVEAVGQAAPGVAAEAAAPAASISGAAVVVIALGAVVAGSLLIAYAFNLGGFRTLLANWFRAQIEEMRKRAHEEALERKAKAVFRSRPTNLPWLQRYFGKKDAGDKREKKVKPSQPQTRQRRKPKQEGFSLIRMLAVTAITAVIGFFAVAILSGHGVAASAVILFSTLLGTPWKLVLGVTVGTLIVGGFGIGLVQMWKRYGDYSRLLVGIGLVKIALAGLFIFNMAAYQLGEPVRTRDIPARTVARSQLQAQDSHKKEQAENEQEHNHSPPPMAEFWKAYFDKANSYLSHFKGTPLTAKILTDAAKKTYQETGIVVPIELALAQAKLETALGVLGRHPATNPYNVFEYDDGTHKIYATIQEGVEAYYSLIAKHYLPGKTPEQLLNNFVNTKGLRYASDTRYEYKLKKIINQINLTFINKASLAWEVLIFNTILAAAMARRRLERQRQEIQETIDAIKRRGADSLIEALLYPDQHKAKMAAALADVSSRSKPFKLPIPIKTICLAFAATLLLDAFTGTGQTAAATELTAPVLATSTAAPVAQTATFMGLTAGTWIVLGLLGIIYAGLVLAKKYHSFNPLTIAREFYRKGIVEFLKNRNIGELIIWTGIGMAIGMVILVFAALGILKYVLLGGWLVAASFILRFLMGEFYAKVAAD